MRELARMVRMVRRGEIDRDLMAAEMETRRILESVGYEIADWEHFAERDEADDLYVACLYDPRLRSDTRMPTTWTQDVPGITPRSCRARGDDKYLRTLAMADLTYAHGQPHRRAFLLVTTQPRAPVGPSCDWATHSHTDQTTQQAEDRWREDGPPLGRRTADTHAYSTESAPLQAPPFRLGRQPHMAHTLGIPPGSKNRAPVRPW